MWDNDRRTTRETERKPKAGGEGSEACVLVIHGSLVVLRRLRMVLLVRVGVGRRLLLVGKRVDPHVAVIPPPLGVSHGSGGEMRGRQHDGGLNALLPDVAAAALLWNEKTATGSTPVNI